MGFQGCLERTRKDQSHGRAGRERTGERETDSVDVVVGVRIDADRDVANQTLLEDCIVKQPIGSDLVSLVKSRQGGERLTSSDLEDLKLGVVAVAVRVVVDVERVGPVASATPLVGDRVGVVRPDLQTVGEGVKRERSAHMYRGRATSEGVSHPVEKGATWRVRD